MRNTSVEYKAGAEAAKNGTQITNSWPHSKTTQGWKDWVAGYLSVKPDTKVPDIPDGWCEWYNSL